MKAAEEKYGEMEDPMPSTASVQVLLSFPVPYHFPPQLSPFPLNVFPFFSILV